MTGLPTPSIARYGHIRQEQLARAVESLNTVDARTFGVVLTWTPTRGPDAAYYGYGYRYLPHVPKRSRLRFAAGASRRAPAVTPAGLRCSS